MSFVIWLWCHAGVIKHAWLREWRAPALRASASTGMPSDSPEFQKKADRIDMVPLTLQEARGSYRTTTGGGFLKCVH